MKEAGRRQRSELIEKNSKGTQPSCGEQVGSSWREQSDWMISVLASGGIGCGGE